MMKDEQLQAAPRGERVAEPISSSVFVWSILRWDHRQDVGKITGRFAQRSPGAAAASWQMGLMMPHDPIEHWPPQQPNSKALWSFPSISGRTFFRSNLRAR